MGHLSESVLAAHLAGALEGAQALAASRHLRLCRRCRRQLEALQLLQRVAPTSGAESIPSDDWTAAVMEAVLRDTRTRSVVPLSPTAWPGQEPSVRLQLPAWACSLLGAAGFISLLLLWLALQWVPWGAGAVSWLLSPTGRATAVGRALWIGLRAGWPAIWSPALIAAAAGTGMLLALLLLRALDLRARPLSRNWSK